MGIPSYFRQITDKYPNIIISLTNKDNKNDKNSNELLNSDISSITPITPTHLFLDFNCLIHPCVQNVLSAYKEKDNIPKEQLEELFLKEIKQYLLYIVNEVKPSKLLYIAIDGVAPRAKMIQQRKRRFRSIMEKREINKIKADLKMINNNHWDKNAITPGTPFMKKLADFLKKFIKSYFKKKNGLNVILSDSTVPGEGEHNILQYLKSINKIDTKTEDTKTEDTKSEDTYIIYGLDADLIMLSMASKLNNIYLLREAVHFGKIDTTSLLYLDIIKLKTYLYDELMNNITIKLSIDKNMLIDDYIFLCFLIGNDFIPKLPPLNIKNNAIDLLLNIYTQIINERKECLLYSGDINMGFLKDLLLKLMKLEDELVKEEHINHLKKRYNEYRCSNEYERRINRIKFRPIIEKEGNYINPGVKYWRNRYYYKLFNLKKHETSSNLEEICQNYIEGIYWTTKYYFQECASWSWCYNYPYAPTIKDLVNYFDICYDKLLINKDEPVTPFIQLLNVLPPQSSHLLPKEYSNLMTSIKSPIIFYYPTKVTLDKFHHIYYHECEPKLPIINMELIKDSANNIKKIYKLNTNGEVWKLFGK